MRISLKSEQFLTSRWGNARGKIIANKVEAINKSYTFKDRWQATRERKEFFSFAKAVPTKLLPLFCEGTPEGEYPIMPYERAFQEVLGT